MSPERDPDSVCERPTPEERRDMALVGGNAPELRVEPAGQQELAHLLRRAIWFAPT